MIKPREWQVTEAMLMADAEVAAVKALWPPDGWFPFGSHVDCGWIPLEFSDEVDDDGLPRWERPTPPPAPVSSPTPDEQAAEDADQLLVAAIEREYDLADPDDEGYRPAAKEIVRVVRQMGWVSSHG